MKKIFGEINLTWPKIIIMGIIMGIYTAIMAMLPIVKDTSFSDLTVTFEVWILFGIFIIMNSKSPKDSALKCFIFFLISQPLVYLIQDITNNTNLFNTYYRNWIPWTIACLPMGYIGYYLKKEKWWSILILTPILLLLGSSLKTYTSFTIFSFPRHILTVLFCILTLIIYPQVIFNNKKLKTIETIISIIIIISALTINIINPPIYKTEILSDGEECHFDNTYKVYLKDKKYGNLKIKYEEGIETWMIEAKFKKAGKTSFIIESPYGDKKTFNINIKRDTFIINKQK